MAAITCLETRITLTIRGLRRAQSVVYLFGNNYAKLVIQPQFILKQFVTHYEARKFKVKKQTAGGPEEDAKFITLKTFDILCFSKHFNKDIGGNFSKSSCR